MAIFHLSARAPITRASGRSATAAAAYRAGVLICDERTGLVFDFRRRHGVLDALIQLPGGRHVANRQQFWNGVEVHHRRRDAVLAREIVLALPTELDAAERAELAFGFAREIANEFGVAVDCALHLPSRDGDDRNHHAHLLMTACAVDAEGVFGKKVERLDPIACRRGGAADSVSWLRPRWQDSVNAALARKGSPERVDHRSFKARGIERLPTVHVGKGGSGSRGRAGLNARLRARNAEALDLERKMSKLHCIKARLVARMEPTPNLQCAVQTVEDRASDWRPWRRRQVPPTSSQGSLSQHANKPEESTVEIANGAVGSRMLRMGSRPKR